MDGPSCFGWHAWRREEVLGDMPDFLWVQTFSVIIEECKTPLNLLLSRFHILDLTGIWMAPLVLGGTPEGEKKYWVTCLIFCGYKHFLQILVWLKGEHNWIYYWWAILIAKSNMKTSLSESKYHRLISDNVRCLVHTLFWSLLTAVGQKVDELLQKWSEKLAELCAKFKETHDSSFSDHAMDPQPKRGRKRKLPAAGPNDKLSGFASQLTQELYLKVCLQDQLWIGTVGKKCYRANLSRVHKSCQTQFHYSHGMQALSSV